jgi:hypothetical protein
MAAVVGAAQEGVDMTADPRQAHTATHGTTAGTTRGRTTELEGLVRLLQQTMGMDRRRKATMEDRYLRSSRDRRLHLRRRGMQMIARRCGGCLALWIRTVCDSKKTGDCARLTTIVGSGELTEAELRTALVNGDWTPFDPHTVRMMIRMFDTNRSGSVNFDEFWYVTLLIRHPYPAFQTPH